MNCFNADDVIGLETFIQHWQDPLGGLPVIQLEAEESKYVRVDVAEAYVNYRLVKKQLVDNNRLLMTSLGLLGSAYALANALAMVMI